jgi:multimeric flavodoxin WrbA
VKMKNKEAVMKALILNGAAQDDTVTDALGECFTGALKEKGWEAEEIPLRTMDVAPCIGCFSCWLNKPSGICIINDPAREVARKLATFDLVVILSPVTFGGYSSPIKKVLDRMVPNALPYFEKVDGEVHHQKRYESEPSFICMGVMKEADPDEEMVFRAMFLRNIRNIHPPAHGMDVISGSPSRDVLMEMVQASLARVLDRQGSEKAAAISRALLLLGTPKKKKSSSMALGSFLVERLAGKGIKTETVHLGEAARSSEGKKSLARQVAESDLLIYSGPLYVDSLPAPAIAALESLRELTPGGYEGKKRLAALVQCGFPEAFHNFSALEILRTFSRKLGIRWMGGLAIGQGGMLDGKPLASHGGMVKNLKRALEMASDALAQDEPIPFDALDYARMPFMPGWLYLSIASTFFTLTAGKNRALGQIRAAPHRKSVPA